MKLDDILGNKELADDQVLNYGTETLTLGELRGLQAERDSIKAEREAIAAERDKYRGEKDNLATSLTDLLSRAGKQVEDDRSTPAPQDAMLDALRQLVKKDDGTEAIFNDPVFGKALSTVEERAYNRAKKEFETLEAKYADIDKKVTEGFQGLTRAQLSERAERWYAVNRNDIPNGADGKRLGLKDIHQLALDRNYVMPGTQLLDYDRALEEVTAPTRMEAKLREAEARGIELGMQRARDAAGKVIPIFGDRSAGSASGDKISTVGKSQRQIVAERLQQGLADLSAEETG